MKSVNKIMFASAMMALICGSAHAALTSHGTATGTITVQNGAEWGIALKHNGISMRDASGTLRDLVSGAKQLTFTVTNNTSSPSKVYIRGSGSSLTSDGKIIALKQGDTAKTFNVKLGAVAYDWNADETAYLSKAEIPANGSADAPVTYVIGTKGEVGVYDVSLELFTKNN